MKHLCLNWANWPPKYIFIGKCRNFKFKKEEKAQMKPILWQLGSENQWVQALCRFYCCPCFYYYFQSLTCLIFMTHHLNLEVASVPILNSSVWISHCTTITCWILFKPFSPGAQFLAFFLLHVFFLYLYPQSNKPTIIKIKQWHRQVRILLWLNLALSISSFKKSQLVCFICT